MEGVRHKAGELKFSKLLNQNHKLPTSLSYSGVWLAFDKSFPTFRPCLRAAVPSLLGFSPLPPSSGPHALPDRIRISEIPKVKCASRTSAAVRAVVAEREQEYSFSPFSVYTTTIPVHFISLLRAWPLPQCQTGDKHEQNHPEDWAENR